MTRKVDEELKLRVIDYLTSKGLDIKRVSEGFSIRRDPGGVIFLDISLIAEDLFDDTAPSTADAPADPRESEWIMDCEGDFWKKMGALYYLRGYQWYNKRGHTFEYISEQFGPLTAATDPNA